MQYLLHLIKKIIKSYFHVFQVSLVLEPLPELYDTSSSVLTTEGTSGAAAAQGSSKPQLSAPSQQPRHTQVTVEQQSVNNSKATTLRYLCFFSPPDKIVIYFAVHTEFFK